MQRLFSWKTITGMFICGIFMLFLASGCSTTGQNSKIAAEASLKPPADNSAVKSKTDSPEIEEGDLVGVNYTMRLEESNEVITTTKKEVDEDTNQTRVSWYQAAESFEPVKVLAGDASFMPELSKGVVGMCAGGKKTVLLTPEKGFGQPDSKKKMRLPLVKKIPKNALVQPQHYVQRFGRFPKIGDRVDFTPYFKSRVIKVENEYVVLEAEIDKGDTIEHDFGITAITFQEDNIVMTLKPVIGGPFELKGQKGRIVDSDTETFTVDFNHPAAGKNLLLDMEIVAVEKADIFANNDLEWIEDYDQGHARAAEEHKPMVMVLYAGWCGFSKKMINNTIKDPRVQKLWEHFVWVKIDSDKNREYRELYEQNGYPLIIMTNSNGGIINKVDGFRDAPAFCNELNKALNIIGDKRPV